MTASPTAAGPLISFARGAPSVDIVDVAGLKSAAVRALDLDPVAATGYGPATGYAPLRAWIASRHGVQIEQVLVTNGSLQGDAFLFQHLLNEGDDVIVERPTYDRTLLNLRMIGAKIHQVSLDDDGLDVDEVRVLLESGVRPKLAHVIPNFQNPAGVTLSLSRRLVLIALAREYRFTIFEDDPYAEIRFPGRGEPLPSMLALAGVAEVVGSTSGGSSTAAPEGAGSRPAGSAGAAGPAGSGAVSATGSGPAGPAGPAEPHAPPVVVHASSFTKTICPGVRVGYLIGPPALIADIAARALNTYISPNMLAEATVYQFCASGDIDDSIATVRTVLAERASVLAAALRREIPDASYREPDGGYFLWVDLPADVDVDRLAPVAAIRGLAFVPGTNFQLEGGRHSMRLAYSAVQTDQIDEGVRRLAAAIEDVRAG